MKKIIYLSDENHTLHFGEQLAHVCPRTLIIFLRGELGAGKTTLTRGFLQGLGYTGSVKSPTYTLVEPYHLIDQQVYHFDLYRLTMPEELDQIGVRDYFIEDAVCLVEWPERGLGYLPSPDIFCCLRYKNEGREIELEAESNRGEKVLENLLMR